MESAERTSRALANGERADDCQLILTFHRGHNRTYSDALNDAFPIDQSNCLRSSGMLTIFSTFAVNTVTTLLLFVVRK